MLAQELHKPVIKKFKRTADLTEKGSLFSKNHGVK